MKRSILSTFIIFFAAFSGSACAQSLLDVRLGMSFDEVKRYVLSDSHLAFQYFAGDRLVIADTTAAYVPGIQFSVAFCPGSKYDGQVVTVGATKFYKGEPSQLIQDYHDMFLMMSGDHLANIIGTRTENDQGHKQGFVGVSIMHHLKDGETWDLGIFNRPEPNVQFIQLIRSIDVDTACKKTN